MRLSSFPGAWFTALLMSVIATTATVSAPASAQSSRHRHVAVGQPERSASAADSARVRAVIQAVFSAAERQDIAALDTLYAGDSLTVVEGTGINRGWADYRDHHLVPELREMKGLEYRPQEIVVHVRGDVAWAMFRYTLVAESGGHTADVVGRGTAILDRRDTPAGSRWVLRYIQTSGRARRPTDPPRGSA